MQQTYFKITAHQIMKCTHNKTNQEYNALIIARHIMKFTQNETNNEPL